MPKKNKHIRTIKQILDDKNKFKLAKKSDKVCQKVNSKSVDITDDFNGYLLNNIRNTEMSVNGYKATLHLPKAVRRVINPDGTEAIAALPPGAPRPAFVVDEYPACPTGWMHGSGNASSYFIPIEAEHGMWLDFNANVYNTHHVALVISVQGINPVTGLKADPIRLEQYRNNCPIHNVAFTQDRFCAECKRKWPAQNYIATTGTPNGYLWLDGFMTEEGVVRQWFFTEEEAKGVAAQLIKQERVHAIGIAIYRSKAPKPPVTRQILRGSYSLYSGDITIGCAGASWNKLSSPSYECQNLASVEQFSMGCNDGAFINNSTSGLEKEIKTGGPIPTTPHKASHLNSKLILGSRKTRGLNRESAEIEKNAKKIEVGAGARINQTIYQDPENLDFWEETPVGFIYINYCQNEDAKKILAAGRREDKTEGFLDGLKLSN